MRKIRHSNGAHATQILGDDTAHRSCRTLAHAPSLDGHGRKQGPPAPHGVGRRQVVEANAAGEELGRKRRFRATIRAAF